MHQCLLARVGAVAIHALFPTVQQLRHGCLPTHWPASPSHCVSAFLIELCATMTKFARRRCGWQYNIRSSMPSPLLRLPWHRSLIRKHGIRHAKTTEVKGMASATMLSCAQGHRRHQTQRMLAPSMGFSWLKVS